MTEPASPDKTPNKSPARILVVDDNAMARTLIERTLVRKGFEMVTASSGDEALAAVAENPVDMIFLDLVMPGMSGMEVLQTLKADDRYRHIPVVVVSGSEDMNAADDVKAAGAVEFLPKPVKPPDLHQSVEKYLGSN